MMKLLCVIFFLCHFLLTSAEFSDHDCKKDVQEGPVNCKAHISVYKWDQVEQKCVKAIYGGCHATNNNFKTEEECQINAAPICQNGFSTQRQKEHLFTVEDCERDVQEGPFTCRAYMPVYRWDQKEQTCVKAVYGGCHSTNNNFKTKEECLKYAAPVCKTKQDGLKFRTEDCQKDVEDGPFSCRAYIPVYKWDHQEQKCVKAIYGGCHATSNNFKTAEDCQKYAVPVCKANSYTLIQQTEEERVFNVEDCAKDVQEGIVTCMAYMPVYKWDQEKQTCMKAVYGGCQATRNNFKTQEECLKYAAPVCSKPQKGPRFEAKDCLKDVEEGPFRCKAYFPRYKWDNQVQKCVKAIYGGCHATNNNFKTEKECQINAALICQKGFSKQRQEAHLFTVEDCERGVEEGPISCKAYMPVYKWDQKEQTCVKAVYGGCHATRNNFKTKEECLKYAAPVCQTRQDRLKFETEDCQKDVEEAPISCRAYISVYKWDHQEQKCVKAIYGGCHATSNNFKTAEDCQKYAVPVCKANSYTLIQQTEEERVFNVKDCAKDVQEGPVTCMAYMPVYKWDPKEQTCIKAVYGGCHATHNNFKTKEECLKYAAPVCQTRQDRPKFETEDCQKGVEEGPISCRAYISVYKWDHQEQQCVKAIYGGCHATSNNLKTAEDCQKYAVPVCKVNSYTLIQQTEQGRVFNVEDCAKDVQEGPVTCMAYMPVYKWDPKEQTCIKAVYGGCHATHNNFKTKEECLKYAAPVCQTRQDRPKFETEDCQKGVEDGPFSCRAYISVYKWDHQEQQCVKAIYGGCHATSNNFKTAEDCQKYAVPVCKVNSYTLIQQTERARVFNVEDCAKDVQKGPVTCMAYMPVYKWDPKEQTCIKAVYGGCHATHNNFNTEQDCLKYAQPVCSNVRSTSTFAAEDCEKGVEEGPIHCMAYIPVYTWDATKQMCVKAIYGGCNSTNNNFKTNDDCERFAKPICKQ